MWKVNTVVYKHPLAYWMLVLLCAVPVIFVWYRVYSIANPIGFVIAFIVSVVFLMVIFKHQFSKFLLQFYSLGVILLMMTVILSRLNEPYQQVLSDRSLKEIITILLHASIFLVVTFFARKPPPIDDTLLDNDQELEEDW